MTGLYVAGAAVAGSIALFLYFTQKAHAQPAPNGDETVTAEEQQVMLQIYGEATSRSQNPSDITFDRARTHMTGSRRQDLHRLATVYRHHGRDSEEFRGAVADFVRQNMHEFGLVPRGGNDTDRIPWQDIIPEFYTSRNRFPTGRNFMVSRFVHNRPGVYEGAGNLIAGAR